MVVTVLLGLFVCCYGAVGDVVKPLIGCCVSVVYIVARALLGI